MLDIVFSYGCEPVPNHRIRMNTRNEIIKWVLEFYLGQNFQNDETINKGLYWAPIKYIKYKLGPGFE